MNTMRDLRLLHGPSNDELATVAASTLSALRDDWDSLRALTKDLIDSDDLTGRLEWLDGGDGSSRRGRLRNYLPAPVEQAMVRRNARAT